MHTVRPEIDIVPPVNYIHISVGHEFYLVLHIHLVTHNTPYTIRQPCCFFLWYPRIICLTNNLLDNQILTRLRTLNKTLFCLFCTRDLIAYSRKVS